ncbi:MAG: cytochrome B5 [Clostridia bacterium]|nr:cytochrome B5 [Clostridia bacterium]
MDPTNLISLEMLATFNGQNTQPAYIAVNGVVYDVTSYWRNGQHHGLTAGADMTTAFLNSPHSSSLLAQLPIVGYLPSDQSIINQNVTTKSSGSDDDDDDDDEHDDEHEEDD